MKASGILSRVHVRKRRDVRRPLVPTEQSFKHGGDPTCAGEITHVPKARRKIMPLSTGNS